MSHYRKTLPITKGITYIDILKKSKQREIDNETNKFKKELKQQALDILLKDFSLGRTYHEDK